MNGPTVAVVGASSHVGAHVVRILADRGFDVRGGVERDDPRWHLTDVDATFASVEPGRRSSLQQLVRGAPAVIYCGGYDPAVGTSVSRARQRGVAELRAVLEASRREQVARLVYVSSACTAVEHPGASSAEHQEADPVDETTRYVPGTVDDPYFETKAAMEAEVYRYVAASMDVVVVLPTLVLGPGDVHLARGRWIRALVRGMLPAVPQGTMVNAVDARDVASSVVSALERGRRGRRYLVGGTNIELSELFEQFGAAAQVPLPDRRIDARRLERVSRCAGRIIDQIAVERAPGGGAQLALQVGAVSADRAVGELQFQPRSLGATVQQTLDWMVRVGYLSWG